MWEGTSWKTLALAKERYVKQPPTASSQRSRGSLGSLAGGFTAARADATGSSASREGMALCLQNSQWAPLQGPAQPPWPGSADRAGCRQESTQVHSPWILRGAGEAVSLPD